jgi:hypothetical protein
MEFLINIETLSQIEMKSRRISNKLGLISSQMIELKFS